MDLWSPEGGLGVDLGEVSLGGKRISEIGSWGGGILAIQVGRHGLHFEVV